MRCRGQRAAAVMGMSGLLYPFFFLRHFIALFSHPVVLLGSSVPTTSVKTQHESYRWLAINRVRTCPEKTLLCKHKRSASLRIKFRGLILILEDIIAFRDGASWFNPFSVSYYISVVDFFFFPIFVLSIISRKMTTTLWH